MWCCLTPCRAPGLWCKSQTTPSQHAPVHVASISSLDPELCTMQAAPRSRAWRCWPGVTPSQTLPTCQLPSSGLGGPMPPWQGPVAGRGSHASTTGSSSTWPIRVCRVRLPRSRHITQPAKDGWWHLTNHQPHTCCLPRGCISKGSAMRCHVSLCSLGSDLRAQALSLACMADDTVNAPEVYVVIC